MSRVRVLVTGTGAFGVGEGLVQCLQMAQDRYEIFAANIDRSASALYQSQKGFLLPKASEANYLPNLLRLCSDESIRFLIPGSELELLALAGKDPLFAGSGCQLLANPKAVIDTCANKYAAFRFLRSNGLPTPETTLDMSDQAAAGLGWPVVFKPVSGHGSKNVFVLNDPAELSSARALMASKAVPMLLQEHIGKADVEYTASALTSLDGKLIGTFAARRTLFVGATATVEIADFPELRELAARTAVALGARGPINIQCRETPSGYKIFEINPRFSGSAPFRALAGFNEVDLLIQSILTGNLPARPASQPSVFGIRAFQAQVFSEAARDRVETRYQ